MSDTRDVIAQAIASHSGSPDSGIDLPGDTPETTNDPDVDLGEIPEGSDDSDETPDAAPEPVAEKKEPEPVEEDDDFAKVPEFEEMKNGAKRVNRIPHPRVKKMIEKQVAAAEKALREVLEKEYGEKLSGLQKQLDVMERVGEIMGTDPDRFMSMLAEGNPAYKAWTKGGKAEAQPDDPEPQPDGKMPDGTPGYTPEQYKKLEDWKERQVEKRVRASMQKEWQDKYGWIDQQREAHQAREAALPGIKAQYEDAMANWEGFKDNFDAIMSELRADTQEAERTGKPVKLQSLRDAYHAIREKGFKAQIEKLTKDMDGLKTDRNKMREEVLAEIGQRPKGTAAVPGTHVDKNDKPAADDPNVSTRDLIAGIVARVGRRG